MRREESYSTAICRSMRETSTSRVSPVVHDCLTTRNASIAQLLSLAQYSDNQRVGRAPSPAIGVKISYAELRLVGEDCWPASGILMNCAGDRDSPRFVSIAKRPCLGRRHVAPTASYEIETRRYADT